MRRRCVSLVVPFFAVATAFTGLVAREARLQSCLSRVHCPSRTTPTAESLGGALFKQIFGGLQDGVNKLSKATSPPGTFAGTDVAAGREAARGSGDQIASIDERAKTGCAFRTLSHLTM